MTEQLKRKIELMILSGSKNEDVVIMFFNDTPHITGLGKRTKTIKGLPKSSSLNFLISKDDKKENKIYKNDEEYPDNFTLYEDFVRHNKNSSAYIKQGSSLEEIRKQIPKQFRVTKKYKPPVANQDNFTPEN